MSEFTYRGSQTQIYPQFQHPEREGVLVVDPDEVVDFGDRLPPADGQWYDSDGAQVLPPEPEPESEPVPEAAPAALQQEGPGTGAEADQDKET